MNGIVGQNLKKLREANQFTQKQVADFLHIERSTYANYESCIREAPLNVLESCASLFGCELELLFEKDGKLLENMLICAFRVDNLSSSDMKEVADFKNVVMNYLKMDKLLAK